MRKPLYEKSLAAVCWSRRRKTDSGVIPLLLGDQLKCQEKVRERDLIDSMY